MTRNCSASQRLLANSLRVVSAERGNPPLRPFSTRRNFPRGATFPLENVMSMRSSLLLCVKFPQKNSSRRRQKVENCSTFQRCRSAEKALNMAVSCWELQWDCDVTGFQLVGGQNEQIVL